MSDRDLQAFQEWRRAKPENALAFEEAQELWQSEELTQALRQYELAHVRTTTSKRKRFHWQGIRQIAYACCLLVLCLLGGYTFYGPSLLYDYASHIGEIKAVDLSDGSRLHLDSHSAIDIAFNAHNRKTFLKQGRIHFDITPNKKRPFLVQTGQATVRVVGTAFDVKTTENGFSVDVREGIVTIAGQNQPEQETVLKAGQGADFQTNGRLVTQRKVRNFGWLQKRIRFQNRSVGDVIAQLSAYTPGPILVASETLANKRITGSYSLEDIDKTLKAISDISSAKLIGDSTFFAVLY